MGISGLLPVLKDITHKTHIREFAGKTAAIDGYVWLYKGAYCCPQELCEGVPTDKFLKYCMAMVQVLLHHKIQPYVVLDGDKLPAKAMTENNRFSSRTANKERGRQLAAQGNDRAAMEMYQKAVETTPEMARTFIEALKQAGIPYVVAPYEADAQMAYMARSGIVDLVITEDSDLLAYGCPEVVFKLQRSGDCDHVRIVDLPMNRTLSFSGMDHDNFIEMCILAGCDFVASLPGMGIKKAHAGVKRFRSFVNVIKSARINRTKVPQGYDVEVQRAYWTFKHQRVWCPKRKTMAHLNELPNSSIADSRLFIPSALPDAAEREALSFLGPVKPDDVNAAIAKGDINPMTHQPFRVQQVGDIVHVTSGDQVASPELKLTQAPRKTAPASLQPHMPHVSLGGHRKASLGVFQPGARSGPLSQVARSGKHNSRCSAPAMLQNSQSTPAAPPRSGSMELFAVSSSSQCTTSERSNISAPVQAPARQPLQSTENLPQQHPGTNSQQCLGNAVTSAHTVAAEERETGAAVMPAGQLYLKKPSSEAPSPLTMKEKLLAMLSRDSTKPTSANPVKAANRCTIKDSDLAMMQSSSQRKVPCSVPTGSDMGLERASQANQALASQQSALCSVSGLSQGLGEVPCHIQEQDTIPRDAAPTQGCVPRSALSLLAAAGSCILGAAGKRKLQQQVETACDKLQATRASDDLNGEAFACDAENTGWEWQADGACPPSIGCSMGTSLGSQHQSLRMRLGLRKAQDSKATLVNSHPLSGISKSTQSALNLSNISNNLSEGPEDLDSALSPGPGPEEDPGKENGDGVSPSAHCTGMKEALSSPIARLASLRQQTTTQKCTFKPPQKSLYSVLQRSKAQPRRSIESLSGGSDPGGSPGDEPADRILLLESFKASKLTTNQFKRPRRLKALN